jgi:transcriptional regulator with XRE-family HTH domain
MSPLHDPRQECIATGEAVSPSGAAERGDQAVSNADHTHPPRQRPHLTSFDVLTGAKLRAHRKAAGLTQVQLAKRAGFSRHAVYYWEGKEVVNTRQSAPRAFCEVLGLTVFYSPNTRARGWGLTRPDPWQERLDAQAAAELVRWREREAKRAARRRVLCGAQTRKGTLCRLLSEPGRSRCKFHGGKSTGPRTAEGRARIAEAQRRT